MALSKKSTGLQKAAGASLVRDTLNNLFEATILRCDSLRGTGERCGRSNMWVWRQLRQNKSFDFVKVAKVLVGLEVPLRYFVEEIADALPASDPAWVLRHLCQAPGPRDPFLAAAEEEIERLVRRPAAAARAPRRRREIEALEENILADPDVAKIELERLSGDLLAAAAGASAAGGVSRGLFADGALALLAWSEAQRKNGRGGDAVAACALAGRLADAAGDRQAHGSFYLQASRLLADFARSGAALRFARIACCLLRHERKSGRLAAAMLQQSSALAALGKRREARIETLAALRLTARTDWRSRSAAWVQLAELAQARSAKGRQLACLRRAKKLARAESLAATIGWQEAKVLGRLGRVQEANQAFRAATAFFNKKNRPLDAARVAIDQLEMFLANDRRQDALKRVRAASPCFERLGSNSRAFELWMDLAALLLAGGPLAQPLAQVAAVRAALEEHGSKKVPPNEPENGRFDVYMK
jgi:hypothetical protein